MDHTKAREILTKAWSEAVITPHLSSFPQQDEIKAIIQGTHKTFRYVLVTGLLAASTNHGIHPRSMQASSSLKGAYDARSLCHKVVVIFESHNAQFDIGSSNEPFLNKPARFPDVSLGNAVRAGNDRITLEALFKVLEDANDLTTDEAYVWLRYALSVAHKTKLKKDKDFSFDVVETSGSKSVQSFIDEFTAKTIHGETSALVVGSLMGIYMDSFEGDSKVTVHPVNQSGASSREISDIDVYLGGEIYYAIEVKDKNFTLSDIAHAVKKAQKGGCASLIFVHGETATFDAEGIKGYRENLATSESFNLQIVSVNSYTTMIVALVGVIDKSVFWRELSKYAASAKVKDATSTHMLATAKSCGWS